MRSKIIYEDEVLLVVHKPVGLATQSAAVGQGDVASELKNYLAKQGKGTYLGIVHRLDQPVEGLLAFAKSPKAAAALTSQLQAGTLHKTYYAVTFGKPEEKEGVLTDYLQKDGNVARVVTGREKDFPQAQKAKLSYRMLEALHFEDAGEDASLLEVRIETGRFHQIRAQLSHAGMPILGDRKYGNAASDALGRRLGATEVSLCALSLELSHPITRKAMKWEIRPRGAAFLPFLEKRA